jgi:hypothetical protein
MTFVFFLLYIYIIYNLSLSFLFHIQSFHDIRTRCEIKSILDFTRTQINEVEMLDLVERKS